MPDELPVKFSLDGRVAFVTGASSGIGRHLSLALARAGASLAVAARRAERLETLRQEIEAIEARVCCVALDVTDRASVEAGFAAAEAALGTVDVLVNNAGVADPQKFLDMTEDAWSSVVDTNLTGVWRVAQVAARRMAAGSGGSIINVASALGLAPQKNQANYCAAKAGVIHLTKVMALELANAGVRVNAIAPGYFETEINADFFASPQGSSYIDRLVPRRVGRLEELDGAVLLLASDAGRFITGAVLPVDGGALLKGF
jgi:NAD(P)-dependent dehydrogenase (short-subunit alcohol dehydrogenase family)